MEDSGRTEKNEDKTRQRPVRWNCSKVHWNYGFHFSSLHWDHGNTTLRICPQWNGSLARKEISPYSDFEHIIALEELLQVQNTQDIVEYFRWYSVIFHIIVMNLQETIIPGVWIRSLNDNSKPHGNWFFDRITTRGISFDGMMPYAC